MDNQFGSAIRQGKQYNKLQEESQQTEIEFQKRGSIDSQMENDTDVSNYSSKITRYIPQNIPQNFGNNMPLKTNAVTGQPKFTIGPHWPLFICAWGSFVAVDFFLIRMMWNNTDNIIWVIITVLICSAHVFSYLITALINPGIAYKKDEVTTKLSQFDKITDDQYEQMYCKKCDLLKDNRTEHCESCDVCVRGFDHHCPWTGKCIAKGNIKPFNVFLTMTFLFMAYAIVITVTTLLPPSRRMRSYNVPQQDSYNKTFV